MRINNPMDMMGNPLLTKVTVSDLLSGKGTEKDPLKFNGLSVVDSDGTTVSDSVKSFKEGSGISLVDGIDGIVVSVDSKTVANGQLIEIISEEKSFGLSDVGRVFQWNGEDGLLYKKGNFYRVENVSDGVSSSIKAVLFNPETGIDREVLDSAISSAVSGKADIGHTHSIENIDGLSNILDGKAEVSAVEEISSAVAGKAEKIHTHKIDDIEGLSDKILNTVKFKGIKASVDELNSIPQSELESGFLYLVPKSGSSEKNSYDEYVCIEENGIKSFEKLGSISSEAFDSLHTAIEGKSDINHTHDTRYYQKTDLDNMLLEKVSSAGLEEVLLGYATVEKMNAVESKADDSLQRLDLKADNSALETLKTEVSGKADNSALDGKLNVPGAEVVSGKVLTKTETGTEWMSLPESSVDLNGIAVEVLSEAPALEISNSGRVFQWNGENTGDLINGSVYRIVSSGSGFVYEMTVKSSDIPAVDVFQIVKPSDGVHLLMRKSADGSSAESVPDMINTKSGMNRDRVKCFSRTGGQWSVCTENGFGEEFDNSPVSVNVEGLVDSVPCVLYYCWISANGNNSVWHSSVFPFSGSSDDNIVVPKLVSELDNDSKYQTESQMNNALAKKIDNPLIGNAGQVLTKSDNGTVEWKDIPSALEEAGTPEPILLSYIDSSDSTLVTLPKRLPVIGVSSPAPGNRYHTIENSDLSFGEGTVTIDMTRYLAYENKSSIEEGWVAWYASGAKGESGENSDVNKAYVDAGLAGKQNIIDSTNKISYNYIEGTPEIPSVYNSEIKIRQGNALKGSFTLNQAVGAVIELDAGGGTGDVTKEYVDAELRKKNPLITMEAPLDYSLIGRAPVFPTKLGELDNDKNYQTKNDIDQAIVMKADKSDIPKVPVNVGDFTNNKNYQTDVDVSSAISGKADRNELPSNPVTGYQSGLRIWTGTRQQYDMIAEKDVNTIYMIRK